MKKSGYLTLILVALSIINLTSCSPSVYEQVYPALNDGKYDSEFPYKNSSAQLENISNTIKLVNSIAFYKSYIFDENSKIELSDIKKTDLEKRAISTGNYTNTASGTGTVIYNQSGKVGILTVAHIVNFPDTLISYFTDQAGRQLPYVQSITVKVKQSNYVPDLPEGGELNIFAIDKEHDLAILLGSFSEAQTKTIDVFAYPDGKASELEWGTFVYVFGYPMNYKMISKAIVSLSNKDKGSSFLIDAVFNRGFSGGLVLAVRDGVPNFELVGLVKSVPADYEYVVKPMVTNKNLDFNPLLPYEGDLYVEKQLSLKLGITKVIPVETIEDFLKKNKVKFDNNKIHLKTGFER